MGKLLYYLLIKPISLLPFWILYRISDLVYLILYRLVGYRKSVVRQNLSNSFPEKSEGEIKTIEKKFYKHLCDIFLETIKMFSITEKELRASCRLVNPELVNDLYDEGKSMLFVAGHYNNWEIVVSRAALDVKHTLTGIYTPLKNDFFESKVKDSRSRFGMELLPAKQVKQHFKDHIDKLTAYIFAIDQSPSNNINCHWMDFLNQETAVHYGAEKYAREYNYPVVYGHLRKVKRGVIEMEFELISRNPNEDPMYSITEKHHRLLEKQIRLEPEYWLWTHRRWKHKRKHV